MAEVGSLSCTAKNPTKANEVFVNFCNKSVHDAFHWNLYESMMSFDEISTSEGMMPFVDISTKAFLKARKLGQNGNS